MKLESSYPYFPASYVDVVCTAGDRALSSARPAGPNSCLTVGSTEGWRSAIWRVRCQAIPHVDRAISGPRHGRAELQHVNSGFGPGAPGHGPAAHTNQYLPHRRLRCKKNMLGVCSLSNLERRLEGKVRSNNRIFIRLDGRRARPKKVKFGQNEEPLGGSNYPPQTRNGKLRLFPWRESSLAQNARHCRNQAALSLVISKG